MKGIEIREPGGPEVLVLAEFPDPSPGPGEISVRVAAAGVNRPDALQRQGKYRPPPGASPIPGLEIAGVVEQVGPEVDRFVPGDRVCALVGGGGYAELAVARADHCLPIPVGRSFVDAAAVPETWFTVWANVFELGRLAQGEWLLVHGGSSGIGHTAIQLASARGAHVVATSRSAQKADFCRQLGARAVDSTSEDFVAACLAHTGGRGVDVVLDMLGGDTVAKNLEALAVGGRHVSIAFLTGQGARVPLATVMAKQAVLTGSFLRSRGDDEKARLARAVESELWPLFSSATASPVVAQTFPLEAAGDAHAMLESGDFLGKLVLTTGG